MCGESEGRGWKECGERGEGRGERGVGSGERKVGSGEWGVERGERVLTL